MSIDRPGGSGEAPLEYAEQQALWLKQRPTINIPLPSTFSSQVLVSGTGILVGVALKESSGTQTTGIVATASSANAAAANNNNLPAGGAGVLNWVTGFEITGNGATAAGPIAVTLTGIITGTLNYVIEVPTIASAAQVSLIVEFPFPGLSAAAANAAITLNVPSFGAGNTAAAVSLHGYSVAGLPGTGVLPGAPVANFNILDGTDANGELLLPVLIPGQGLYQIYPASDGPVFGRGLFLQHVSGNLAGSVWVKI